MTTPTNPARRTALATLGLAAALATAQDSLPTTTLTKAPDRKPIALNGWDEDKGEYILPKLPYDKAALEPHIDAQTMEIHHSKHHAAYVSGANRALKELASIRDGGDAALIKHWSRELSFHLSGHMNHTLFWNMLAPNGNPGGGEPKGPLATAIARDFSSFAKFAAHFKAAAVQVEGGGWAWLALDTISNKLIIVQQEKQQDMLPTGCRPILGIDVWEHAYYLKYQSKRADYVTAFFNVINWPFCSALFEQANPST
jgi:Fe-Mn family superoxide dismutase